MYRKATDADGVLQIIERLKDEAEHAHIDDIALDVIFTSDDRRSGGKMVVAEVHLPNVQGKLRGLFEAMLEEWLGRVPDFLLIIDINWWEEAAARQREALIWHELCHIKQEVDKYGELRFDQDGNPKYGLAAHDVTAFNSEVARYGAWSPDLQKFLEHIR